MHYSYLLLYLFLFLTCPSSGMASEGGSEAVEVDNVTVERGLAVYKKSNCAFCHGWAGDGKGHPRSPGVAASLRDSMLDSEAMSHVIRCGVIGGVMPYHDRMAYRDNRCLADPGSLDPESWPPKGKNISARDLDALLSYIGSRIQGQGDVTFEQCEAFYKTGSRNCLYLQADTNR